MNSDRPHSNPEQACFALGCSFDAYIAGLGAGRDDLIRNQDQRDYVMMRNVQGAFREWPTYPWHLHPRDDRPGEAVELHFRGSPQLLLEPLQDQFEDWARPQGLNLQKFRWERGYVDPAARWAWRAWQARVALTSTPSQT